MSEEESVGGGGRGYLGQRYGAAFGLKSSSFPPLMICGFCTFGVKVSRDQRINTRKDRAGDVRRFRLPCNFAFHTG